MSKIPKNCGLNKNLDCVNRIYQRTNLDQPQTFDARWQAGAIWHQRNLEPNPGSFT
jgi:hypothetical protein